MRNRRGSTRRAFLCALPFDLIAGLAENTAMKAALIVIAVAVVGFFGYAMLRPDDPVTAAKLKCEFAIESATGYDVGLMEVSRAAVTGDVFNGTVTMPFNVAGRQRNAVCIFESGTTRQVTLDGQLLAGRR